MAKKKFRELVANQISFKWPNKKVEQLDTAIQLSVIICQPREGPERSQPGARLAAI